MNVNDAGNTDTPLPDNDTLTGTSGGAANHTLYVALAPSATRNDSTENTNPRATTSGSTTVTLTVADTPP